MSTETWIDNSKNQKNNNNTSIIARQPYQACPQHCQLPFYGNYVLIKTYIELILDKNSVQVPIQPIISPIYQFERTLRSVFSVSEGEQLDNIELIDMSSLTPSNLVLLKNFSDETGEFEGLDLHTGRIGEQMVYTYLLSEIS
ncbi:unnamed protein product [Rotaria sp. Silwood2]|nr:unnamed protein product [Rotaria sp. Silwood2]